MYQTVHSDQATILHEINALYLRGEGIDLDPMYGNGGFYKDFPEPIHALDIKDGHDAREINEPDSSMRSMILDPPFMHAQGKDSAMGRYASYPSQKALHCLYGQLIREAHRVLVPGGILIFKIQDTVESGKQVWSHIVVHDMARASGFTMVDLFILVAKSRMVGHNHGRQVHARKHHAYFMIFRKDKACRQKSVHRTKNPSVVYDADGNAWFQLPIAELGPEEQKVGP